METAQISFELSTSDAAVPLAFEAWINDLCVFKTDHVTETQTISFEVNDEDGTDYSLRLIMSGKTHDHTVVDDEGNITQDARLSITNVCFDEIELDQVFLNLAVYVHNFNGNGEFVNDQFFGEMGCNGTVELKFLSPIYIWLLENM